MFKKFKATVKANILVGFFLTVPVATTILIFNFVFKLATNWLPESAFPELRTIWHGYPLRVVTLLAVIMFFYLVGLLTRNFLGKRLYQFGEKILLNVPFVKGIYVPVRQISESLFTQRKTLFKEVVLVEYPRKGLYSLAFVTAAAPASVTRQIVGSSSHDEPCVSLFISTTPNPTSGVFILVPRSETIPLNMPVSDALTFIMSAGAVAPGAPNDTTPTLLDKLESWLRQGDASSESSNAPNPNPQR